ncbi:MAG: glycosyltransferase family 4 protein [Pyrinomonadaceae bacterium]
MKKRILQLTGSFNQGGSERQAISLAATLKQRGGLDVYLATLSKEGPLLSDAGAAGFDEIPEFPLTSFYDINFLRQVRRCAKYLRSNKIDVVHTHDFYTNVFGIAAATLARVPLRIASKRETAGLRSAWQEMVERLAFSRANAIVVNSDAVRDHLLERGIASSKLKVIYNGLDIECFSPDGDPAAILGQLGLPSDAKTKIVTLVANLRHNVKNVPMLLRAAAIVLRDHPNTHFIIAGEGELESSLKLLAAGLQIAPNVRFLGRCSDVPGLLSVSDVCVLTSNAEGFSNSILEYMAAGKPVVATNVGGAAEAIIDGETGYLVQAGNETEMAARLVELLGDPRNAAAFGARGRQIVAERFSREKQVAETIELYEEHDRSDWILAPSP